MSKSPCMARIPRVSVAGGIYHVTCRGNERRTIFKSDRDRERLLKRLAESAETFQVRIYLYCFMSNHIHLLVETPLGNLSRFMGSVLTGYTVYYNRRYDRSGHLMQGRYGSQLVEGDEYLLKLSRYIHLNPVQIKAWKEKPMDSRRKELHTYRWSSFPEYAGFEKPCGWLTSGPMLGLMTRFGQKKLHKAYARYVELGLSRADHDFADFMKTHPIAIGSESFVDDVKKQSMRKAVGKLKKEDVSFRSLQQYKSVDEVTRRVREVLGKNSELLNKRKDGAAARGFYAWSLHRYAGLTQRAIASYLNVHSGAAICLMLKRAGEQDEFQKWRKKLFLLFKG